jgi:hypothetical protein
MNEARPGEHHTLPPIECTRPRLYFVFRAHGLNATFQPERFRRLAKCCSSLLNPSDTHLRADR